MFVHGHTFTTTSYSCANTHTNTHPRPRSFAPAPCAHLTRGHHRHILPETHTHLSTTKHPSSITTCRPTCTPYGWSDGRTHTPDPCRGPAAAHPLLLTHNTGQDQNAEAEGGQDLGPESRRQHFWGFSFLRSSSVPPCSALLAGGGGGCTKREEPSPGCLPTPLGRDFRERGPGDSDKQRPCPPLLASLLPTLPALWPDRGRQKAHWPPPPVTGVQILAPPHLLARLSVLSSCL